MQVVDVLPVSGQDPLILHPDDLGAYEPHDVTAIRSAASLTPSMIDW